MAFTEETLHYHVNNAINENNGGNANPQVTGGIELGKNICGLNVVCP